MRSFREEYSNSPQGADLNATTPLQPFSRHVAGDGLCEPCVRTFLESFLHDVTQRQAPVITAAEVASRFLHEQDCAP